MPSAAQDATDAILLARQAGQPRPQSGRSTMAVQLNGEPWKFLCSKLSQARGFALLREHYIDEKKELKSCR